MTLSSARRRAAGQQSLKTEAGTRRLLSVFAGLALMAAAALPASAAELLMFTRKACPYCVLWEKQIGPIYPKTDEAQRAPLRRIDLDRPPADMPELSPRVTITPTFVIMDEGKEIGRFSGYSDELTFWSALTVSLAKLPAQDMTKTLSKTTP